MTSLLSIWGWEIAAMASSFACLATMVILLAVFDGRQVFAFHGVTLNAITALLSTFSKTTLLFVLGSTIGQWKWILYSRGPRPLLDAQVIDEASRGPLGSLHMIWRMRNSIFMTLGALCTVLTIATDPMSQQLIQYQEAQVPDNNLEADIPRAQRFSKGLGDFRTPGQMDNTGKLTNLSHPNMDYSDKDRFTYTVADSSIQSAALYGITQSRKNIVQQLPTTCFSRSCNFSKFQSLAVCNRCINVSDSLTMSSDGTPLAALIGSVSTGLQVSNGTRISLPSGLYIQNPDYGQESTTAPLNMVSFGTGNTSLTLKSQDIDTLIWSMTMIRAGLDPESGNFTWPNVPIQAHECALYYCVNEYNSTIVNGSLVESLITNNSAKRSESSWQAFDVPRDWSDLGDPPTSIEYNSLLARLNRTDLVLGENFAVSPAAVDSISAWFHVFMSMIDMTEEFRDIVNGYHAGFGERVSFRPDATQSLFASENLTETFDNIATSLSNAIRAGSDDSQMQRGTTYQLKTHFHVQWGWISLHAFLAIVGLVDLVLTGWTTKHEQVKPWKSQFLPAMAWGGQLDDPLTGAITTDQMERIAQLKIVGLKDDIPLKKNMAKETHQPWEEQYAGATITAYSPLNTDRSAAW